MRKVVTLGHDATYPDPITLKVGDEVILTGKTDCWDGHTWLWAKGPDGKTGWLPDTAVEKNFRGQSIACRNYSAMELTCATGETVLILDETHGWAWCRSLKGMEGWIPLRNLSPQEVIES
ncbi:MULTISPECIES: SH3 domain-containing protein [unclassified Phyllobacterium]|uniref:SH3 domain-containing protein n=1 Tax=Phyllobacterium TaxID=28100 RepID=UPI000DD83D8C|nr:MULTISPECIES: SH3 domain-containing protein [unclassified Phyllobacterium]MBA8901549.1 hypothetical protein [Phyllobacterium sp. P30BS-XVII]UGX84944.1 SH3 domain-containing protein [Phyllobacterium sp. T1293]